MPISSLERRNIEASIQELQKEEAILGKYNDKGWQTLQQAMNWLSGEIDSLEAKLVEQEEESD